jgi:hypothetical protein
MLRISALLSEDVAALVAGDGMKRLSLADRAVVVLARHLH